MESLPIAGDVRHSRDLNSQKPLKCGGFRAQMSKSRLKIGLGLGD